METHTTEEKEMREALRPSHARMSAHGSNQPNLNRNTYKTMNTTRTDSGSASVDSTRAITRGDRPQDKRYLYKTAWTLVGGYGFTSQQCVAIRYIGLGQYRINESPETLHECHLRDFVL